MMMLWPCCAASSATVFTLSKRLVCSFIALSAIDLLTGEHFDLLLHSITFSFTHFISPSFSVSHRTLWVHTALQRTSSSHLHNIIMCSLLPQITLLLLIHYHYCLNIDTQFPITFSYPGRIVPGRPGDSNRNPSPHFGHSVLVFKSGPLNSGDSTM